MRTLGLLVAALALGGCLGVDRNNFKTCDQSGFCKRLRPFKPEKSQYTLNLDTVIVHGNVLSAEVNSVDTESEKKTVLVNTYFILLMNEMITFQCCNDFGFVPRNFWDIFDIPVS